MLVEVASSLLTAARGIIAAFGLLCIVVHGVLPMLTTIGELVLEEIPTELTNWQLMKAQETELCELEERLTLLQKRRARQKMEETQRMQEEYQTQATRRDQAQRRKQKETTRRNVMRENEEEEPPQPPRVTQRSRLRPPTVQVPSRSDATEKNSLPKRRSTKPLQLLSPNVPVDRHSAPAYVKANAGITKPVGDCERSHQSQTQKSRILSLGSIFEEVDEENKAPRSRIWAH